MAQVILNGLVDGLLIAAIGLAFAVSYWTARRGLSLAIGGGFTLAPYVALAASAFGGPLLAIAMALSAIVILSVGIEAALHRSLEKAGVEPEQHFIVGLACMVVLEQVSAILWSSSYQVLPWGGHAVWRWSGLTVSPGQGFTVAITAPAIAGLLWWIQRSKEGLEFRALAEDSILLETLGRNAGRARLWIAAISGALMALAALARARDVGFDPYVGTTSLLMGLLAALLGGRSGFLLTTVLGVCLGMLRGLLIFISNAAFTDCITFAGFALLLAAFPSHMTGLAARKGRLEAR